MNISSSSFASNIMYKTDRVFYGTVMECGMPTCVVLLAKQLPASIIPGVFDIIGNAKCAVVDEFRPLTILDAYSKNGLSNSSGFEKYCIVDNVIPIKYMLETGNSLDKEIDGEAIYPDLRNKRAYMEAIERLADYHSKLLYPNEVLYGLVTPIYNDNGESLCYGGDGVSVNLGYEVRALEKTEVDGVYRNISTGLYVIHEDIVKDGHNGVITEKVSVVLPARDLYNFPVGEALPAFRFQMSGSGGDLESKFCKCINKRIDNDINKVIAMNRQ